MRRYLAYPALLALLLTTAFAGCQREPLSGSGDAICFSVAPAVVSAEQTKADDGRPHGEGYLLQTTVPVKLYGGLSGSTDLLFNGVELLCTDAQANTWTYSPLRFWVKNSTHNFRAVFPPKDSGQSYDVASDELTVVYDMASSYDLMVASAEQETATRTSNQVNLPFEHACAALRFRFTDANGDTAPNFEITSLELQNLSKTGTLTYKGVSGTAAASMNWAPDARVAAAYTWTASTSDPAMDVDEENKMFKDWFYVIPQTLTYDANQTTIHAAIHFTYTLTDGLNTQDMQATLNLDTASTPEWARANAYTYDIKIQPNAIVLDVTWTDWVAGHDDFNYIGD